MAYRNEHKYCQIDQVLLLLSIFGFLARQKFCALIPQFYHDCWTEITMESN